MSHDFRVDPRIDHAATLPSAFYKDPAVFERSKDAIFARHWQYVLDSDQVKVPGSVCPITMLEGFLDEPILAVRNMDDQLRMLANVCTHRGMQVVEGAGNQRSLRCRYHGRRFGLDGQCQFMPEFEGVCGFPAATDNLAKVPFGQLAKLIFAAIDPTISLDDWLKPVMDRVGWMPMDRFVQDPTRGREYLVRANWALYVDNYLEGFHIPYVHASLNEVIDYGNYTTEQFEWSNLQLAVASDGEDAFDLPQSSQDFGKRISAYYFWLFPNTMLNFYPWGLSINVVRPLGPDLTKVNFIPFVWDASKLGKGAGGDLDRVEREDEAIVELVQRGVRSRFYDRGRFSVAREANVHHFHRLLAAALAS